MGNDSIVILAGRLHTPDRTADRTPGVGAPARGESRGINLAEIGIGFAQAALVAVMRRGVIRTVNNVKPQNNSRGAGRNDRAKQTPETEASAPPAAAQKNADSLMQRVVQLVEAERYTQAVQLLTSAGPSLPRDNARGVCLLRLGRYEEALNLFRRMALKPGCTWIRREVPAVVKANYATALLLAGHPTGCREALAEIAAEDHPAVRKARQALTTWKKELSFWQRLNWWLGVEVQHPATIDRPGDLLLAGDSQVPPREAA